MTNPVDALTRAFLIEEGFDPDEELQGGLGIAKTFTRFAEIAVETLKGIGWVGHDTEAEFNRLTDIVLAGAPETLDYLTIKERLFQAARRVDE